MNLIQYFTTRLWYNLDKIYAGCSKVLPQMALIEINEVENDVKLLLRGMFSLQIMSIT